MRLFLSNGTNFYRNLYFNVRFFIFLFCIWIILSGYLNNFFIIAGILSCASIIVLLHFIDNTIYRFSYHHALYVLWLFYQMIISALLVTRMVWQCHPKISPTIVKILHNQVSDGKITLLANSITLTPGTITIHHNNKYLYIHALVKNSLQDLGYMKTKIKDIKI